MIGKLLILNTCLACLATHIQNDSINFQKTSMFIFIPKIHFIIHFFLEILHYRESYNLTGLLNSILIQNSRTRISPNMGLVVKYQQQCQFPFQFFFFFFSGESNYQSFLKNLKNPILGAFWAYFRFEKKRPEHPTLLTKAELFLQKD